MNDAQFGLLFASGLALFAALIAHTTVCAERHECVSEGTCYDLNSGSWYDPSCSFRTTVTPAGFKLLNASVQYETMQRMNRGVCSPGLRQQVDAVTGDLACVRKRSWPDAYLAEIGEPGASTDHERHCGKWIDAGSIAYGEQKWAFYDAEGRGARRRQPGARQGRLAHGHHRPGQVPRELPHDGGVQLAGRVGQAGVRPALSDAERRLARHGARERRVPRVALLRHARARGRGLDEQPSRPRCCAAPC